GGNSAWVGPFTFTTSSFPSNYTSELVDGWARGVIQDPSGNYVWAGYATNNGSDFQVVKTDQGGNIIWTETIGESGTEMAFDIVNSGDGGYVIAGHTNSATLIASGSYDIMVTKLDANGNHVWTRVLGTSGSEYSSQCSIIRNPDNTFSVAAITVSDMLFAQIAANGTLLAMKTLNTQSSWAYALTKASGTNGGWAVAGRYSGPFGGSEFMVTKLKSDGIYDWSMVWGDGTGTGEILYAIVENAADDYTVFGYTYAEGTTPQNMYATRFTNSGSGPTVSWIKAYGTANGCAIYDAVKASDGNYIVTGYCFGGSYTDTYLMKINAATGAIIWQTEKPDDGSSNRQGDGVYIDAAGSYLVAGLGGFDMLKFAPDGTICGGIAGTAITDDLGTTYPYVDLTEGNSNNTFGGSNIARTPTIASFGTPLPGCNAVLPVKLTSFNAICENQGVRCDWQTSAEINNHYFTVERSTDALNFETIGTVYGNGTSHSAHTYSFIDDQPLSGKAYYRLKQTDYDGKSEYFQVKSVECGGQEITIYPNPFEDFIQLNVNTPENSPVEVIIENNLGQVVFEKQLVLDAAASRIDLPSTIRKGMYQVYIIGNSKILQVEKLIKL
ncbi:MAG: T9SS type A sorting domain-containing protein, partial [Flavobacteriales bacterium]|nr:T9SS type A sorting domain-containing protein [Flavobacteriales bacterium]